MQRSFARVKEQWDIFVKYSCHDDLRGYMARLWTLPVNHGRIRRKDQDSIMPEEPKVSKCDIHWPGSDNVIRKPYDGR